MGKETSLLLPRSSKRTEILNRVYGKRKICFCLLEQIQYTDENSAKIILTFDVNPKLLSFTEKLKTASGKYRINMVVISAVYRIFHMFAQ